MQNRSRCSYQNYKIWWSFAKIKIFLASFQAPSASVVGEIKDVSWSRDVNSVMFWSGLSFAGKQQAPDN